MRTAYTIGSWQPHPGQEEAFVAAWTEFARWGSTFEGAGTARLARDAHAPERFLSFLDWDSLDAIHAWKGSPEFKERMGVVQQHVDTFAPSEVIVVVTCETGEALSV